MDRKWYFAKDYTLGDDFSDHGTEVFKNVDSGSIKFKKFARELVQNSLDVKNEEIKDPLFVEFKLFEIEKNKLPSFVEVEEHINGTIDYCDSKNKHNNAYKTCCEEMKSLSCDTLKVLKISDYNTKGIRGSKNLSDEKSAWTSLVFNDGDSVKASADSLGSHGLGKGAAFALSKIMTVFYNTFDIDGNKALQGVTRQYVSYVNGEKKHYKGYFGNFENNKSLPLVDDEISELDDIFKRNSKGSDVYVLEPNIFPLSEDDVKWYLIESIICNFFMAIIDGTFEFKVCGTEVRSNNLENIIIKIDDFYKNKGINTSNEFVHAKQSIDTYFNGEKIEENITGFGLVKLWLHKNDETKDKLIAIIRKNGMLIKYYSVSASQKFSGVVIVEGQEGVEFLKALEDPNHTDFDPSRATEDKYGNTADKKKRLDRFYDWMKSKAKEFTKIITEDTFTLAGMEDYIQMPSLEEKKYDSKQLVPKVLKPKPPKVTNPRVGKKTGVDVVDDGVSPNITEVKPPKPKPSDPSPNPYKPGSTIEEKPESKKKGFIERHDASFVLGPVFQYSDDEATLVFKITEFEKDFRIKLTAVDEDGKENNYLPKILSAYNPDTCEIYKIDSLVIKNVKCKDIMRIKFKFERSIKTCIKPIVYWEEKVNE